MMPDRPTDTAVSAGRDALKQRSKWSTPWAAQVAELYFSGTTAAFVLHGNTYDYVRIGDGADGRYGVLSEFLAEQLFGRWSLVLHYDLGRGPRVLAGRDEQRLKDMVALANRKVGDLSALPKDPAATFALLDRFVRTNIMAPEADRLSLAFILDQASYVFPSGEPGRLNAQASSHLVTINRLVDIVEEVAGIKLERRYNLAAPQGVRGRNSDNTRILAALDWEPRTSLEDGMEQTYIWIRDEMRSGGRDAADRCPAV